MDETMKQPLRAVFLDRDGVINRTIARNGVTHPPERLEEFEFLPGVTEAARELEEAGFTLLVATNQPDVARGKQSREEVEAMNDLVRRTLPVREVWTCYHDNADSCTCRKPKPGLLTEAAKKWGVDLSKSYMVGDRWSDIVAGQAAGCQTVLVLTPFSGPERCQPDRIVRDLPEAADWILSQGGARL